MRLTLLFAIIIIAFDGCIKAFEIDTDFAESLIVVEGLITDQPGPYTVKLTYTNDLDNQLSPINKVKNAIVVIKDNNGTSETLSEVSVGVYQTMVGGIQGIIGNEYSLSIMLSDNSVYESEPEKLLPVGEIQKIYKEFDYQVAKADEDFLNPKNGFRVYVDANVLPEQEGLTKWRVTGTWQIRTFPEKKAEWVQSPTDPLVFVAEPKPPACSGYVKFGSSIRYVRPCECCICWVTEYNADPILSSPEFDVSQVNKKFVAFIPANKRFFYNKYHVQIEQMSVSRKIFTFMESIKRQRETGSDLFQTPAPKTLGNITTVNGSQKLLGYFGASSVRTSSFFFERSDIPYYVPPIDTIADSCLAGHRYATTTKPFFW